MTRTPNSGHGHVFKRPDGLRMRCGGPSMCKECAADLARLEGMNRAAMLEAMERWIIANPTADLIAKSERESLLDAILGAST